MNEQDKDKLNKYLMNASAEELLRRDMEGWRETLEKNDDAKVLALKKILLLLGSGNLQISDGEKTVLASENKLPVSEYLSGHMGRVYISLPKGEGKKVLEWIAGDASKSGLKPRFVATHDSEITDSGEVLEKKLYSFMAPFPAASSFAKSLVSKSPRIHYGMNVAMGGKGNKYKTPENKDSDIATIKDDGTSGHVYFNLNEGEYGDSLGIGLEGTAPSKSGYLGSHSFVGGADDFTALEGDKFAVVLSRMREDYLDLKGIGIVDKKNIKERVKSHLEYKKESFLKGRFLFSKNKPLGKKKLIEDLGELGVKVVGNGSQILTPFGKKLSDMGIVLQANYNGAKIKFEKKELNEILALKDEDIKEISNKIIHCKPKSSNQEFLQHIEIIKDFDKEFLEKTPHLTLEEIQKISENNWIKEEANVEVEITKILPSNLIFMVEAKKLSTALYKPKKISDESYWADKQERGNKLRVVDGLYEDKEEVEQMLINVIISIVDSCKKPKENGNDEKMTLEDAINVIEKVKKSGGAANSKTEEKFDSWEKKFSGAFQKKCQNLGILTGRQHTSKPHLGLRTTFIPLSVIDKLKEISSTAESSTAEVSKEVSKAEESIKKMLNKVINLSPKSATEVTR